MTLVDVLPAYDQALTHCDTISGYFNDHALPTSAFLPRRAKKDIEIAVEALLMGRQAIVADSMRDVMEIELLCRDFAVRPNHIERWAQADENTLIGAFAPSQVRRRIAEDLYPEEKVDLPEAMEYEVHSMGLHPDPRGHPLTEKGVEAWQGDGKLLFESGEILGHAIRFFKAVDYLLDTAGEIEIPRPVWHEDLDLLQGAHRMWMAYTEEIQNHAGAQLPPRQPRPRKARRRRR
jgi:hypothetical protein